MSLASLVATPLTQRTDALVARIDQATESLLTRFSAIAELSFHEEDLLTGRNASTAAATSLQIEDYAHQMVRAAEDLRTIIREVKEAWILGETSHEQQEQQLDKGGDAHQVMDIDAMLHASLIQLGAQEAST